MPATATQHRFSESARVRGGESPRVSRHGALPEGRLAAIDLRTVRSPPLADLGYVLNTPGTGWVDYDGDPHHLSWQEFEHGRRRLLGAYPRQGYEHSLLALGALFGSTVAQEPIVVERAAPGGTRVRTHGSSPVAVKATERVLKALSGGEPFKSLLPRTTVLIGAPERNLSSIPGMDPSAPDSMDGVLLSLEAPWPGTQTQHAVAVTDSAATRDGTTVAHELLHIVYAERDDLRRDMAALFGRKKYEPPPSPDPYWVEHLFIFTAEHYLLGNGSAVRAEDPDLHQLLKKHLGNLQIPNDSGKTLDQSRAEVKYVVDWYRRSLV